MQFETDEDHLQYHQNICDNSEKAIDELEAKLKVVVKGDAEGLLEITQDQQLKSLLSENQRLHYRINIMKNVLAEHTASSKESCKKSLKLDTYQNGISDDHMTNILGHIESFFSHAIHKAYPEIEDSKVTIQVSKVADYQCNAAMALAKKLKKNPKEVGEIILKNCGSTPLISKLEVSGPGFINVVLDKDFISSQITNLILKGVTAPLTVKKKVIVDFSSPNVAKEMHVGHLRSTIIGESICRLLEFLGHDVGRVNHLGDWGTQFGMLITHLKDKFPDFIENTPPIKDLQAFYKESKARFDDDAEFKKRAYDAVVKLQSRDPDYCKGWQQICDISKKEFNKIYKRLNVTLTPFGESFYQERMVKLVEELDNQNMLLLEDGRKLLFVEGGGFPLTVVKSDGGFTYDTSDLACLKYRIEEEKCDWCIYVVDAGQGSHLQLIYSGAQKIGYYDPSKVRVDHVAFGVVLGEDKKKFKTRSGDTVRLADLLDEGLARAEDRLNEKEREKALTAEEFRKAKEAVAYGCIKYADLSHDRTRDYIFSFDRMLDIRGNTAAYLLYALTRIRSITRNSGIDKATLLKEIQNKSIQLDHEKEWKLAKTLLKMADVIVRMAQDLYIHPLCEYLYEISTAFTEFYDNCYCIEKDEAGTIVKININRLLLCEATATVMEKCFNILGISTLEKM